MKLDLIVVGGGPGGLMAAKTAAEDGLKVLVIERKQAAIACGFQAVKAIQKETDGKKGMREYAKWWQQAFAFNRQDHFKTFDMAYSLTRLCTSEEIDQIYRLFQDRIGIPPCLVNKNMGLIKEKLPQLYEKLTKSINQTTILKANKR